VGTVKLTPIAQGGKFGVFVGGQPVVNVRRHRPRLADPAAQGLRVHARIAGQPLGLRLRISGALHPHRSRNSSGYFPGAATVRVPLMSPR
jgi:hypothetical protein